MLFFFFTMFTDYWIIPQMTRTFCAKDLEKGTTKNPFDFAEVQGRTTKQINDFTKDTKYLNLNMGSVEDILTDPRLGYVKGKDFFVMKQEDHNKVKRGLQKMIHQYRGWSKHMNRYIFIIDRRHPENITSDRVKLVPNIEAKTSEKIYMIAPKEYRRRNQAPNCICGAKLIHEQRHVTVGCSYCGANTAFMYEKQDITPFTTRKMWTCSKKNIMHKNGWNLCLNECNKDFFVFVVQNYSVF